MHAPSPSFEPERAALRAAAGAVLAHLAELQARELAIRESEQRLVEQEAQVSSALSEQQARLRELKSQLQNGREEYRVERQRAKEMLAEAEQQHRESGVERARVRELRSRFNRRMRLQWQAARIDVDRRRIEAEAATRNAVTESERLTLQRQEFEQERIEIESQRQSLSREREAFEESRRREEELLASKSAELTGAEQRCIELRAEARGLEHRVAAARRLLAELPTHNDLPAPVIVTTPLPDGTPREELRRHLAALADQRSHLAEMCSRLTIAKSSWQREQLDAITMMEQFAFELHGREEQLLERARSLERLAERLKVERESQTRARNAIERREADFALRNSAWLGDQNLRRIELEEAERRVARREQSLAQLFERLRQRRQTEVAELRRLRQASQDARTAWIEKRDEFHRRTETLRSAQEALLEQNLALEEARREFLDDLERSDTASRRLEALHRRWQGLSAASRRDLETRREELEREDEELRRVYQELETEKAELSVRERELEQLRIRLDHDRELAAAGQAELESARRAWSRQRREYELMLVDLRAELERMKSQQQGLESPQLRVA